jgi:acyl-coenzyme A thioesterase 9
VFTLFSNYTPPPPSSVASSAQRHLMIVPIAATRLQAARMTQPQEQNTAGKIFGGWLMRQALEVGFMTSRAFLASIQTTTSAAGGGDEFNDDPTTTHHQHHDDDEMLRPALAHVDEIHFLRPVAIGSLVTFTGKILYNEADFLQVRVLTEVYETCENRRKNKFLSNKFDFTFAVKQSQSSATNSSANSSALQHFRRHVVVPQTYSEAVTHLDAKRAYRRFAEGKN